MDWDSSSYSSSDSDSASSESTTSSALSDNHAIAGTAAVDPIDSGTTDFPFDFAADINRQADGSVSDDVDGDDGYDSATESLQATTPPRKLQITATSLLAFQEECVNTNISSLSNVTTREES
eukprot:CAMPEP_0201708084 /NCGR_PEP_ID=MMETSP0578-20130828/54258_1 /ASSEMBLY_ACC=CAM_ASM_000663 /TAXON_ID=267565 /ORGANISM="Skeletonema grethea, Strain CCMP 1804" /LENGTH=121 /DNA_ID=CAMNT_0048196847 /DNA_START=61 /DNA_END=422 /DNA_ORIENTATION=+